MSILERRFERRFKKILKEENLHKLEAVYFNIIRDFNKLKLRTNKFV